MKKVLEPLTLIPGVRLAAVISPDGVPIAVLPGAGPQKNREEQDEVDVIAAAEDHNAFAGFAAGWLSELAHAIGQMSWTAPRRVVLRATRGALVVHQGPVAILLVVLEHGVSAEELRVPLEGANARMQRLLRPRESAPPPAAPPNEPLPGIFPAPTSDHALGSQSAQQLARNQVSEIPGDN